MDPPGGVPTAGLADRHTTLIKGRQSGQHRQPQPWIVAERRNALGRYQGFRDKSLASDPPHQNFQLLPGQVSPRPALDPTNVTGAGKPATKTRPPLQWHDSALQEIAEYVHRGQATNRKFLNPIQEGPELRHEAWFYPPLLPVEFGPVTRKGKAVVDLGTCDHLVVPPVLRPHAAKGGDVGHCWIWPCLEVVGPKVVFALPRPHQHKKLAEEGSACCHNHEHLTEMDKDGHLEDGVGREVLELKSELLQQQQEERRNRQRQPAEEIGDEEHKLPGSEIAEGGSAGPDPPGERRRAPSEQAAHCVERLLSLVMIGANQHGHGNHGAENWGARTRRGVEGSEAKGRSSWGKCESKTTARGKTLFQEKAPRAPWKNLPDAHLVPERLNR
jgi:hypothetical protein